VSTVDAFLTLPAMERDVASLKDCEKCALSFPACIFTPASSCIFCSVFTFAPLTNSAILNRALIVASVTAFASELSMVDIPTPKIKEVPSALRSITAPSAFRRCEFLANNLSASPSACAQKARMVENAYASISFLRMCYITLLIQLFFDIQNQPKHRFALKKPPSRPC
jgi:hypothetical protein